MPCRGSKDDRVGQEVFMSEIVAVVETANYRDDLDAAQAFHRDVLGPEVIGREAGRPVYFRVGDGLLLAFHPLIEGAGSTLPSSRSSTPGLLCSMVRR
jgi:hypothetical protein